MITSGLVLIHDALKPLLRPVEEISHHPQNPNNGDLAVIMESIQLNGMYRPVYVQAATGWIVAGNGTYDACRELGAEQIPVLPLDVDEATARRIVAVDNQSARKAVMDVGLELALLEQIHATDSLLGTGYVSRDLEKLRALTALPLHPEEDLSPAVWPMICVQVPPATKHAYYSMTDVAVGSRERFEMLLRLAGWEG